MSRASRSSSTAPPPSGAINRRVFLAGASVVGGSLVLTGALPKEAEAAAVVSDAFNGLAAFVAPGNDRFSERQGVSTALPGGVANGAAAIVQDTLDAAIPVVLGESEVKLPGALAYALLLSNYAMQVSPLSLVGPFGNAFANLTWIQKREALIRLDAAPPLDNTQITYAGNALITLAALGSFSEGTAYDWRTKVLSGAPVGWQRSKYQGVSDGHADFIGYYQDRTEVSA
ncbi:MAG: twin-arginine translocation signal domain-containing protein [Solirubrobacteraceae bacterium]|nr:twin-arginine translocation signal domain-containing protein [Solirubrobacteraceae bacterium]